MPQEARCRLADAGQEGEVLSNIASGNTTNARLQKIVVDREEASLLFVGSALCLL